MQVGKPFSLVHWLWLLAVVSFFCVPLFIGLEAWDLRNDEAIYTYAVDRMLETRDWLTPRLIPYDGPFLEKPPLKFWIVAGAIYTGVLPHNEFGFRFFDALFGAIAFIYVFLLGRRLSGPLCGFVAVLVLFTLDPLLYEHGIRGNHMEAPLLLSYCGGIYHFARWTEESSSRRRLVQALTVGAYFAFGFMMKFVAIGFLPLVCALALAWQRDGVTRIRSSWREWMVPAVLVVALTAPWFIYQAIYAGSALWQTMVGEHVFKRFTGVLVEQHLEPWHHYFSQMWFEATLVGSHWIYVLGVVVLAGKAWTGQPWLARLVFLWWIVPFGLMSIGTSKLFHYAYPFLPPLALGAGAAADALFRLLYRNLARTWPFAMRRLPLWAWAEGEHASRSRRVVRQLLLAAAALAFVVGVWTAVAGRIEWEINGVELLRNSSVARPIIVAIALIVFAGPRAVSGVVAAAVIAAILPVSAYPRKVTRVTSLDRPLRTVRDCTAEMDQPGAPVHVYPRYDQLLNHSYFYYLHRVGRWVHHGRPARNDELERRVFTPGQQTLILLTRANYKTFEHYLPADGRDVRLPLALGFPEDVVLLTPGPFEICASTAIAAGGKRVGDLVP